MSEALFKLGGLRFWHEDELELREMFQQRAVAIVKRTLLGINPAWRFARCEGPILHPRSQISAAYDDSDVFVTNHIAGGEPLCLRAETTPSSYAYARWLGGKMPLCVWQAGISSRRETNDGASASKLRFNSFWQLEFQCIYRIDTKADYRGPLMDAVAKEIARFTQADVRIVPSDRTPTYSMSTLDIEAVHGGVWREMASCSIRTDYADDMLVCEIAIGLDRVSTLSAQMKETPPPMTLTPEQRAREILTKHNALITSRNGCEKSIAMIEDSEPLGRFLSMCVEMDATEQVQSSRLYELFCVWCKMAGEAEWEFQRFSKAMKDMGFVSKASNGVQWLGIHLIKDVADFIDKARRQFHRIT